MNIFVYIYAFNKSLHNPVTDIKYLNSLPVIYQGQNSSVGNGI